MLRKLQHTPKAIFFQPTDLHVSVHTPFGFAKSTAYLKVENKVNIMLQMGSMTSLLVGLISDFSGFFPSVMQLLDGALATQSWYYY